MMTYFCCTENRRNAIKAHPTQNGINYIEVIDDPNAPINERQTTLVLHLLKPLVSTALETSNFLIKGGERIQNINVLSATAFEPSITDESAIWHIKVDQAGDFSNYTLCLVDNNQVNETNLIENFDLLLSKIDFSFKVLCPNHFDCKTDSICPPDAPPTFPQINYLSKDYASFRQLMLDRMALLVPDWTERSPADLGMTLVELLAYTADYLSYQQDAITTEAYLMTARKRISVKRHARLVDYWMHDGCNARTWVQIKVKAGTNATLLTRKTGESITKILTKIDNRLAIAFKETDPDFEKAIYSNPKIFEPLHDILLYEQHNELHFYTYGEKNCCLPKGATNATLLGNFTNLKASDVLIFKEIINPKTGQAQDANPYHQQAIRITKVAYSEDIDIDFYNTIPIPAGDPPMIPITLIEWHQEDALTFPLCISHQGESSIENVSVAYGNILLVDHGMTLQDHPNQPALHPNQVPDIKYNFAKAHNSANSNCAATAKTPVPSRFYPNLSYSPLTFAAPYNPQASATSALKINLKEVLPTIFLTETNAGKEKWIAKRDLLLDSASNSRHFVVEIEADAKAYLRFGNDKNGKKPNPKTAFKATYRIGNGRAGNIGANTLHHIVSNDPAIISAVNKIWNPMPAQGGKEKETIEEVRQYAPQAFRTQERAVTSEDYNFFAKKCRPDIQRASTNFRWTGSWKTAFVTTDRQGGANVDVDFENSLRNCLEKYRMAGLDLEVDAPIYRSLEISMKVCVLPDFYANDVKQNLLQIFSKNTLANGQKGFFHPDNFTFGQSVFLSKLYAAAQSVQGVSSVNISKFKRIEQNDAQHEINIDLGKIIFERQEIARLDNDPNFPERGLFQLQVKGGR